MTEAMYEVVIAGAGVLGLSIAQELVRQGIKVAIVARDLPEDAHSAAFASPWAGANWASFAGDNVIEQRRDTRTFHRFAELSKELPHLVGKTTYKVMSDNGDGFVHNWYKDLMLQYRDLGADELPLEGGMVNGVTFSSYTVNSPLYISHIADSLRSKGVPFLRYRLASLDEAFSCLGGVKVVVNATGLGARSLLGVEDEKVFPARGQTILVQAPWMRICHVVRRVSPVAGESTYVIPRPGPEGHVILGGSFAPNDFNTLPDARTATRILKSCFEICPELANSSGRDGKSWRDIKVINHNVGLRPCREGGLRLEIEYKKLGIMEQNSSVAPDIDPSRKGETVGVVHAYGIGPAGFQASIGVAEEAVTLVQAVLENLAADRDEAITELSDKVGQL